VSITDHAGDTILGRHPEHGFVIDGDIQRDTADLLMRYGFRHDEDHDVLVLPADMPEATARELLGRAAQVLAMTRHNVSVLPDEQAAALAAAAPRVHEASAALTASRERLLALVRRVHISPGCLPVPGIQVPTDRNEFDADSTRLAQNLFAENGDRAPRWVAARERCTHLPAETVLAINEVIYRWYQLLNAAGRHIEDGNKHSPYDLAWSVRSLDAAIAAVPPAPERDVVVLATSVGELNEGEEFSLDAGESWYVFLRAVSGSDTIAVYTGEHDRQGDAHHAMMPGEGNQPCLVRIPLAS
jgi:hypothetical protein